MAEVRYIKIQVIQDLKKKMVFVGGPRQVGKTTLAMQVLEQIPGQYLNWDSDEDRNMILKKLWLESSKLVVFDEIHKYSRWKQWIKGVWDTRASHQNFLITGSARLDIYKKTGDSLMGRYHYWRLHPFTVDDAPRINKKDDSVIERLLTRGGFPEPYLQLDERESRRWRRERFNRILREDVRDLGLVKDVTLLQIFVEELRIRAGKLLSLANLAGDLEISPKTAKSWLNIAQDVYILFAIYPYSRNIPRSITKPAKAYFYDNADLKTDDGTRFENLVATTLLKRLHYLEDFEGYDCKLHYIRDKDGREVDFVTIIDGEVDSLIEVKLTQTKISSSLLYYREKIKPKSSWQVVKDNIHPIDDKGVRIRSIVDFVQENILFQN